MLNLGTDKITALSLGGERVQKAYLGEALVFGSGDAPGPSRLPEGYTEVEYIQSSGTQYIDAGTRATYSMKITMDVEPLSVAATSAGFYGSQYAPASGAKYFLNAVWSSNGFRVSAMATTATPTYTIVSSNATPRRMTIVFDGTNKQAWVEGEVAKTFPYFSTSSNMSNLVMLAYGAISNPYAPIDAKLYSCQIENDGAPIRDFVPCVDPAGAVGLYDLVEGKFYGNVGTGAFIAGPAV